MARPTPRERRNHVSSKRKRKLTDRQERRRIEGLRILARIIARHYLSNPHLYRKRRNPGQRSADRRRGGRPGGGWGVKRRQPASRVKLDPHKVWELLNRLNMTQNELARLVGTSSGYLSQLMSGTRCPSADMRRRLMEALGVTRFEDLFILEDVE